MNPERSLRFKIWLAALAITSFPFLFCTFVPSVDLPQHVAHVRALWDAMQNENSIYQVNWRAPYLLAYFVLSIPWFVFAPIAAAKWGAWLLLQSWVGAVHALGGLYRVRLPLVLLATLTAFNASFYWGFLSFYLGFPFFCAWLFHLERAATQRIHVLPIVITALLSCALYWTHLLWWFVAGLFFVVHHWLHRRDPQALQRFFAHGLVALIPMDALIRWYPTLAQKGFVSETLWTMSPTATLSWDVVSDSTVGLFSYSWLVLAAIVVLLLIWVRPRSVTQFHPILGYAAVLFLLLALFLPEKQQNTILFSERWLAPAFIFGLFLLSDWLQDTKKLFLASAALLFIACAGWTAQWRLFETRELTGLQASLNALPDQPRLLGLDFRRESQYRKGSPFLQMFAYGQAMRGGELNFSFVSFGPLPVEFKNPLPKPWTQGLEWFPQQVRMQDFQYFDTVLVNAEPALHAEILKRFPVQALTQEGYWRLYRSVQVPK